MNLVKNSGLQLDSSIYVFPNSGNVCTAKWLSVRSHNAV